MAVNSVLAPYPTFFDASGAPLEGGLVYIGSPGFEARSTPKASFFDVGLTIPTGTASGAAIRTKAGFPINGSNAPAMFYVDGDFSISVCDKNGVLLYSALNTTLALNVGGAVGPVLAADGSLGAVGIGFVNETNTGFVRSGAGVMQTVVGGTLVAQQTNTGTVFQQPVSGTGFVSGVAASLDADLTALAANATNGLWARTGAGTGAARTITGGAGVTVTNGDGVAGNPTITSGARVLLSSQTASASATLNFTAFNNAVYRYYEFELENVKPATNSVTFHARVSTDGGATYDSAVGAYGIGGQIGTGTAAASLGSATSAAMHLSGAGDVGNTATCFGVCGRAILYNAGDAAQRARLVFNGGYQNPGAQELYVTTSSQRLATQDTDAFQFFFSAGNIASGVIRMYGVAA